MSIKDNLHRFIFDKAPIRGEFIQLIESYQTIVSQHDYPPPLRRLLGEALAVVGLLSAVIKFTGRLTLQFRGKGNLKLLLVQCDNHFQLRGLAKWEGELSYEDLMASFNEGVLVIMLDAGVNKGRYQGIVSWCGNSLVESIEGYFRHSEQLATRIWLNVNETTAAGFLLQVVPGSTGLVGVEEKIIQPHWERILHMSSDLKMKDMLHYDTETLLVSLYPDEDIRVFPAVTVKFGCTCSRKRGADAILVLGQEEAEAELKDKNSISVTCDFCNEEYIFDRVDVAKIFEDDKGIPPDTKLH